jgi:hypothetical protein
MFKQKRLQGSLNGCEQICPSHWRAQKLPTGEKMLALPAANRRDALERFGMGEPSSAVMGLYESLRG